MKKHVLSLTGAMAVVALVWSTVLARPDEAREINNRKMTPGAQIVAPGNCAGIVESTGFEPPQWDAGVDQICGAAFAGCVEPAQTAGCTLPGATENCCGDYPNATNCWFTSSATPSCAEPHIDVANPLNAGGQHLRLSADASGATIHQAFTPLQDISTVGRTVMEFYLYGAPGGAGLSFRAFDDSAVVGHAYAAYMYFGTGEGGGPYMYIAPGAPSAFVFVGYFTPNEYKKVTVDSNPCCGVNAIKYYYDGVEIYSYPMTGGAFGPQHPSVERTNWLMNPNGGSVSWDVDDYTITRFGACDVVCGDGCITAPEECEPTDDSACPGRCVDCACVRENLNCDTARDANNGDNGPYLTDGGYFKYTADTPFITIENCDSDFDSVIVWDIDPTTCPLLDTFGPFGSGGGNYAVLNDDCRNTTYGGYQERGTPGASCYIDTTPFQALSCLCVPTVPGTTYNFAVLAYSAAYGGVTPPVGSHVAFNINKKLECSYPGVCSNSCNGACGSGTCGLGDCDENVAGACTLDSGHCSTGQVGNVCTMHSECDIPPTPPTPDVCQGDCVASNDPSRIGLPCKGDRSCDDPAGAGGDGICGGFCQANTALPCSGDPSCPPFGGDPGTPGTCTLDAGHCSAGLDPATTCTMDSDCNYVGTKLCTSGPRTSEACAADADCNECTAGGVGDDCLADADCKRCTTGMVGNACAASADCLACTRGPNAGSVPPTACTVATQDADCGGKYCSLGDIGALCVTNGDCTVEGEKVPGGACCDGETGLCKDGLSTPPVLSQADCDAIDASGDFTGQTTFQPGKLCEFETCIRHTGACCDNNPKAVHCTDGTYPEDCVGDNKSWVKGGACQDNVCPALTLGACCNTLAGTCTDDETQTSCGDVNPLPNTDQRVFTLDTTCANTPCDADLGACCDHDPFGGCSETTNADCQGDKLEWFKLQTCSQIDCRHNAIPTVSTWGLAILTLLLLTGAKIYFGRRKAATA